MRTPFRTVVSALAPLGLLLAACNPGWVPRDVHPTERLEDVGNAGYRRICNAYEDHIREVYDDRKAEEMVCMAYAVKESDTRVGCEERMERCLDRMPEDAEDRLDDLLEEARCGRLDVSTSGCRVTVGELVTCLDAMEFELARVDVTMTCREVNASFDDDWWKIPLPQSCREIRDRC